MQSSRLAGSKRSFRRSVRRLAGAPLLLSMIAAGAPAVAQAPAPMSAPEATPIVLGQSLRLSSAALGEERTINVYLPPSYARGSRTYSVIYLLDGGTDQDFFHMAGTAHLGDMLGRSGEAGQVDRTRTGEQRR